MNWVLTTILGHDNEKRISTREAAMGCPRQRCARVCKHEQSTEVLEVLQENYLKPSGSYGYLGNSVAVTGDGAIKV